MKFKIRRDNKFKGLNHLGIQKYTTRFGNLYFYYLKNQLKSSLEGLCFL